MHFIAGVCLVSEIYKIMLILWDEGQRIRLAVVVDNQNAVVQPLILQNLSTTLIMIRLPDTTQRLGAGASWGALF